MELLIWVHRQYPWFFVCKARNMNFRLVHTGGDYGLLCALVRKGEFSF